MRSSRCSTVDEVAKVTMAILGMDDVCAATSHNGRYPCRRMLESGFRLVLPEEYEDDCVLICADCGRRYTNARLAKFWKV